MSLARSTEAGECSHYCCHCSSWRLNPNSFSPYMDSKTSNPSHMFSHHLRWNGEREREREVDLGSGCHRRPQGYGGHLQPRGLPQSSTFAIGLSFVRVDLPFSTSMRPFCFRYCFISNLNFFIYFNF